MITLEFLITSLIVVLIPGPGVVLTVSSGIIHGRHASVFTAVGCTAGILPQFVEPNAASPLAQLLLLSGIFMAMTFAMFVVYGFLAHAFRKAVIESPRVQSWLRRTFAAAFAGLGLNLALSDR